MKKLKKIKTLLFAIILMLTLLPLNSVDATEEKTTIKVAFPIQYGFHKVDEDGTFIWV